MALIKCPECGKDISNTTENCIHCGYFLNKKQHVSNVTKVLIEQTDKRWKKLKLISLLIFVFGFILIFGSIGTSNTITSIGSFSVFISIFVYYYAVFNTWWEHK